MIAVGLQDDKTEPFTYYGPFQDIGSARKWLEDKHASTYEIRGNYDIIQILKPSLSSTQEAGAYNA